MTNQGMILHFRKWGRSHKRDWKFYIPWGGVISFSTFQLIKYTFCATIVLQRAGGVAMSITIRLEKEEEEILRGIVEAKNTNMSVYVRELISEKIDEEIDREMYKKAVKVLEDSGTQFVSWEEDKEELGITDEI